MEHLKWPEVIVMVRHPECEHNVNFADDRSERDKPNHLSTITAKGFTQAKFSTEFVRQFGPFDERFASTFLRTQDMMEIMAPGEPYIPDSRLDEWWRGVHHLHDKQEVAEMYPHEQALLQREGLYHHRSPSGENGPDVELRIHSLLNDLRIAHGGKRILMSAHGRWMIFLWRILGRRTVADWYQKIESGFQNASVLVYESCNDGRELQCTVNGFVPWDED